MTIKQEYRQFFNDYFQGLKLRAPLFFNWDNGLRFDLQVGETDRDEYFEEVLKRSSILFKSLFGPRDNLFFVLMDYKYKRRKIRVDNFCFQQIEDIKKNGIAFLKAYRLYEPNDKYDIRNIAVVKSRTENINFENILKAIGNTDFPPRAPRLDNNSVFTSKEIYFMNIDKKLIFHMYDDRGLDIIANDIETLRPIYDKYNTWILESNRGQIDGVFKKNGL